MTDTDTSVGNGIPVIFKYLHKRRKTRPRLSDALVQDLESYSQKIVEVAERREGSQLNRIECDHPLEPKPPFVRRPEVIRGTRADEIIESTVIPESPRAKLSEN